MSTAEQLEQLRRRIRRFATLDDQGKVACLRDAQRLQEADDAEIEALLGSLLDSAGAAQAEPLLAAVFEQLWRRSQPGPDGTAGATLSTGAVAAAAALYRKLGAASNVRHHLLRALAAAGDAPALGAFVDLVVSDPPREPGHCDLAFVPLLQHESLETDVLFPRLFEALANPDVAALVLDLANHVTERGLCDEHPAADRLDELLVLFGGLAYQLQDLEQKPNEFADSPEQLSRQVGRSVELLVALCHALALIGDARAEGRLRQALELSHRRLRTEAAAALARLGVEVGVEALAEMAAEPVARRRAVAYLEELGQLEKVDPEHRTPEALAAGEFANWLAEPAQMGLGPHSIDVVDHCRQHWPGYAQPVDCFLLRYEYRLPGGVLRGVGIAGPLLHCMNVDLEDLPPADIYAAYAGWQAEHEEIQETAAADFSPQQKEVARAAAEELEEIGYEDVKVAIHGRFFGTDVLVATARVAGQAGVVVADADKAHWFPAGSTSRPLGPHEAWCIYKGRRLLQTFNP